MSEAALEVAQMLQAGHLVQEVGVIGLATATYPSIKAVGKAFGDWTDWRLRNVLKLGEKLSARETAADDGQVHPRVIHEVIERGSWTDDDVAQEYLAGALIASRCEDGDDDESAYLASIVASMSSAQIRLHHAFYSALNGSGYDHATGTGLLRMAEASARHNVFIPLDQVLTIIGHPEAESLRRLSTALGGLAREGLIGSQWGSGSAGDTGPMSLPGIFPADAGRGSMIVPTPLGTEVFLQAYGLRGISHNVLLDGIDLPATATPMPVASRAVVGRGSIGYFGS